MNQSTSSCKIRYSISERDMEPIEWVVGVKVQAGFAKHNDFSFGFGRTKKDRNRYIQLDLIR